MKFYFLFLVFFLLNGCAVIQKESKSTIHHRNACLMLKDNKDWLYSTLNTSKKWGVPISVQLAIINQESSFIHNARPIKKKGLFFTSYRSSALGYAQALDGTWSDYIKATGNKKADRTSFKDASDFIGWYLDNANRQLKIPKTDAKNMYLAYHDGIGGYRRGTYKRKAWLIEVSDKVQRQANIYQRQILNCNF